MWNDPIAFRNMQNWEEKIFLHNIFDEHDCYGPIYKNFVNALCNLCFWTFNTFFTLESLVHQHTHQKPSNELRCLPFSQTNHSTRRNSRKQSSNCGLVPLIKNNIANAVRLAAALWQFTLAPRSTLSLIAKNLNRRHKRCGRISRRIFDMHRKRWVREV